MDEDQALPASQSFTSLTRRSDPQSVEQTVVSLYENLRPQLVAYAFHFGGSVTEAEDAVQAAFLQLYDQLVRSVEITNLRGWLYRVVHNVAVRQGQADRRQDELGGHLAEIRLTAPQLLSAEDELIRHQQIKQALAALNERERHCLLLRAEGLRYREIAAALGISEKSVSVYLARALRKFEATNDKD